MFVAPPQPPAVQYPTPPQYYQQPPAQYQAPPQYYPQPQAYYAAVAAQNRMREIDRTKTGLLLIIIGILLYPLPFVNFVGDILILIGAILVIVGRKVFGSVHARNTIWSIIIFVIGVGVVAAGILAFAFAVASATIAAVNPSNGTINPTAISQSLESSFNILLVFTAVGLGIFGIAEVLFTYALQKQTGRILLWTGYAASLAVAIVTFLIISPQVANAASQSFTGTTYNGTAFADLQTQEYVLGLLNYIPAVIFAGAIYLAWSRIRHGDLPAQPQPTTASGPTQPPPAPPPQAAPSIPSSPAPPPSPPTQPAT